MFSQYIFVSQKKEMNSDWIPKQLQLQMQVLSLEASWGIYLLLTPMALIVPPAPPPNIAIDSVK
jgi:hypothetical protein